MLDKLLDILQTCPPINKKIMKLVKDVMDCNHVTLFASNNGSMIPYLSCGANENTARITNLVEYCFNTQRNAMNIRDLNVEPLADSEIPSVLNSCLIIPIYLKKEYKTVLCLLRESKEFSKTDENFANEIVKKLSLYKSFISDQKFKITISNTESEYKSLRKFSIPQDVSFDFYEFFYETKAKLNNFFNLTSCTVYIADHKEEQL